MKGEKSLTGIWSELGDATYGFLVNVQPSLDGAAWPGHTLLARFPATH